jgi:hypothetical protein
MGNIYIQKLPVLGTQAPIPYLNFSIALSPSIYTLLKLYFFIYYLFFFFWWCWGLNCKEVFYQLSHIPWPSFIL